MPAQSGDPISSALQVALSGVGSRKDDRDITQLLSYSAKQILLSDIKYEEFTYDSKTFLSGLKSKYIVISEKDNENSESNAANSSGSNSPNKNGANKICSPSNNCVERSNGPEPRNSKPSLPTPSRTLWPPDAVSLGWKSNTPVGGGFINLWNSCYINSTLQALFHIPSFVNWLLMDNSHKCSNKTSNGSADCLICAMAQTLKNSQESTGKAIKPGLIYSRLKSICKHLNPGTQEDAHEFLRHLVDSLDRTYLSPFKDLRLDHLSKETTPLSQIFGGYLRNEVVCQACGHVSTTFQYFQDLPLDIANSSHLDGALDLFFSRESVSEHEGYKCEHCKRRVPFTKKFTLEKAPKVLCVQLKRFGAVSGKNNKSLSIAGKLNLNRFRAVKSGDNFEPYHLAAVVNHIGTSTSCGHYTAIAMAADNRFYLFDDQRVERLHELAPNSSQAYILLYHQKPNVPNGVKPELNSKIVNSSPNVIQTVPLESAKERLFGKGDSNSTPKNSFKIFNNSVFSKVTSTVTNSISSVFTKVNGSGPSSSTSSNTDKTEAVVKNNLKVTSNQRPSDNSKSESYKSTEQSDLVKGERTVINSKVINSDDTRVQNGHKSNVNKSLVPYNESSCSSEDDCSKGDCSRPQTPEPPPTDPGPSPPKKARFNPEREQTENHQNHTNGDVPTEKNGFSPSNRLNGHLSPGKTKYSNGNSNSVGVSCGKYTSVGWTVTSSPSSSPAKSDPPKSNWKIKGSDEGRNDFKSNLLSVGHHRGYGKPVSTWSGDKSEMDKEMTRENYINKRMPSYNDSYDMPNKKIKRYRGGNSYGYDGKNRFNDVQKRKNNWYKAKREYRFYSGDRPRNGDFCRSWNL